MTQGKGSTRRPSSVDAAAFAERWAKTFGNPAQEFADRMAEQIAEELMQDDKRWLQAFLAHRAEANADAHNTTQSEGSPDA